MSSNRKYNQDTIELLAEVNSGCKMAVDSLEQIASICDDKKLMDIIQKYNKEHIKIEEVSHRMLNEAGESGREPGLIAKTFAQIQSSIKMMMKDDVHQAASILTDGCNMGIKSLCEYKNKYKAANEKSVELCEKLCDLETQMMKELQALL